MRYFFLFFMTVLTSCDYGSFDKDKRQITAKNVIYGQLPQHSSDFDILAFREDTLLRLDSAIQKPIRYTETFTYKDSTGLVQTGRAEVLFANDGHSVIGSTTFLNPNPR